MASRRGGYIEGRTIAIEQRWAEGRYDRLPELAADLVQRGVAVIATAGGEAPAVAAQRATTNIPVTFVLGTDPVGLGLVSSLSHPGGNVTGTVQFTTALESKRLGLLREAVPTADPIATLVNPTRSVREMQFAELRAASKQAGVRLVELTASAPAEFEPAFATIAEQRVGALLVAADPFFFSRRGDIVALAARYKVPAIYEFRDFPDAGGLMSYGTDLAESYRQIGIYVSRILKGEKPADLPVIQSIRFEFVINLITAKALGLELPPTLLARADEVIE
jgi:putative tryptophan/tyrosine transport system substrate-binding protein